MPSGRAIPQVYNTIKKRKLKNISFKKAFLQCSFTISDIIFRCLKIYIWQNIKINITFQALKMHTKVFLS